MLSFLSFLFFRIFCWFGVFVILGFFYNPSFFNCCRISGHLILFSKILT